MSMEEDIAAVTGDIRTAVITGADMDFTDNKL